MNLVHRHDEIAKEVREFFGFSRKLVFFMNLRLVCPKNVILLSKIYLCAIVLAWKGSHVDLVLYIRREQLDSLCSQAEKSNPYYAIVYSSANYIHPLSEHLEKRFPNSDWTAFYEINRLRVNTLPRFSFTRSTGLVGLVVGIFAGIFGNLIGALGNVVSLPPDLNDPAFTIGLVGTFYVALFLLAISLSLRSARKMLERTGNVLQYMAICSRYKCSLQEKMTNSNSDV